MMKAAFLRRAALPWIALSLLAAFLPASLLAQPEAPVKAFLVDDFSSGTSALGTSWEGFTDRVMGGKSDMKVGLASEDGRLHLAMSGNVSLANNGGFIQARLMLASKGKSAFDASAYSGMRIVARGQGSGYYLFLRTTGNVLPWSFFMAPLPVTQEWTEILVPWSRFTKGDFGSFFALDLRKLSSIAVVAYKKAFAAALDVREISFY